MMTLEAMQSAISDLQRRVNRWPVRPPRPTSHRPSFWGRITGSTAFAGNANRWKYAITQVDFTGDDDADRSGGIVLDGSTAYALNTIEMNNTNAAGLQGHGVDTSRDDYPAGFDTQPVGVGAVVEVRIVMGTDGAIKYLFTAVNHDDGTCEEAA